MRLPQNTKEEKVYRDTAIQTANKYAIEIPMETAEKCFRVMKLSEKLVEKEIQTLSLMRVLQLK